MQSILGCNKSAKTIVSVAFKFNWSQTRKCVKNKNFNFHVNLIPKALENVFSSFLSTFQNTSCLYLVPGNCIKSQKPKKISFHSPGLLQSRSCCPVMLITTECTIDPRHLSKWLFSGHCTNHWFHSCHSKKVIT